MKRVGTVVKKSGTYVLQLQNPKMFYVGTAGDIEARIAKHRAGTGSAWCRAHGGVLQQVPLIDGRGELEETVRPPGGQRDRENAPS